MSGDTKKSCPELNSEAAIKWADENNLTVILPNNNQLLLDIDSKYDRKIFDLNRGVIDEVYGIVEVQETPSRSKGGHTHITVTLKTPLALLERIALQAVLGSDRRRETHSIRRLMQGEINPTLLFEKKPVRG